MEFSCPHCSRLLTMHDSYAGQIVSCPFCNDQMQLPDDQHRQAPLASESPTENYRFVTITMDRVGVRYGNPVEAKLALKELKLIKRQLSLFRKQLRRYFKT